jgi:hypothetical protein
MQSQEWLFTMIIVRPFIELSIIHVQSFIRRIVTTSHPVLNITRTMIVIITDMAIITAITTGMVIITVEDKKAPQLLAGLFNSSAK